MNRKVGNSFRESEGLSRPALDDLVCLEGLDIRVDSEGVWYWDERPLLRKEMVCLLSQALVRDPDGAYWLRTPTEEGRIRVDDAPFQAVEMFVAGHGREQGIGFRTNVDRIVPLDSRHGLRLGEPPGGGELRPYLDLGDGMEARLTRAVFYQLVELGREEELDGQRLFGIWSCGRFFVLGEAEA